MQTVRLSLAARPPRSTRCVTSTVGSAARSTPPARPDPHRLSRRGRVNPHPAHGRRHGDAVAPDLGAQPASQRSNARSGRRPTSGRPPSPRPSARAASPSPDPARATRAGAAAQDAGRSAHRVAAAHPTPFPTTAPSSHRPRPRNHPPPSRLTTHQGARRAAALSDPGGFSDIPRRQPNGTKNGQLGRVSLGPAPKPGRAA
jgi:hypothetical protein